MQPKRIGRYIIQEVAGRGGMATVYRAIEEYSNKEVAIKLMLRQHLENDRLRVRFNREAELIRDLSYPTIVPLIDFGEYGSEKLPFLVMDYMPRGTLKERVKESALPSSEVIKVMQRIGLALDYAHSRGVIHRDIKPGNILFGENDLPYLGDFGIALATDSAQTALTGDNLAVGTPHYMSPEQGQGEEIDKRTDVYALGVILFEMLTGRQPYATDTPVTPLAIMLMHVQKPIPNLLAYRPELPAGFANVINTAMAKDRTERFKSAGELVNALKAATRDSQARTMPAFKVDSGTQLSGQHAAASVSDDANPSVVMPAEPIKKKRSIGWALFGIMGLIILLALCAGGSYFAFTQLATATETPVATDVVEVVEEQATSAIADVESTDAPATLSVLDITTTVEEVISDETAVTPSVVPTLQSTATPTIASSSFPPITIVNHHCNANPIANFPKSAPIRFEWRWDGDFLSDSDYLEIRVGPANGTLQHVGGRVELESRNGAFWQWEIVVEPNYIPSESAYRWQVFWMTDENGVEIRASSDIGCITLDP